MSIDYNSKITEIIDFLKGQNSATASPNLSASLTTTAKVINSNILADDPNIVGHRGDKFPAIFVSLNTSDEVESQMGELDNRKKFKTINYDIHGLFRRPGMSTLHANVLNNFYQLAENTEAALKFRFFDATNVISSELTSTDFKSEQPDNSQIKVFKISFSVRYFYS